MSENSTASLVLLGLVPGIECYDECKIGWDDYIQKSLFKFLAENKGLPDEF